MKLPFMLLNVLRQINVQGGSSFIVGGSVRDYLMGLDPKDIDIEVYGMDYPTLHGILAGFGWTDIVGKSFGVIKSKIDDEYYDFSLPRTDSKRGIGHKGFDITVNPDLRPEDAAARRDFTVNTIMFNPLTGKYIDTFKGVDDIEHKLLRCVGPAFAEDPLRVLRGMQFCGRFDFTADKATLEMCQGLVQEYNSLSKERVWEEWAKWAVKSTRPSNGLNFLDATNWLGLYPQLYAMKDVPQDHVWHPEGDVWTHTKLVVNYAAYLAVEKKLNDEQRLVLVFSALCHDMAKAFTTEMKDVRGIMRWTSHGHEAAGGPSAKTFLKSINCPQGIIDQVVPLVQNHLAHSIYGPGGEGSVKSIRRLAQRLHPSNIDMLALLCEADASGRDPLPKGMTVHIKGMLDMAHSQKVFSKPQPRLIEGRHVIAAGISAGPEVGVIVREAYDAQMDNQFSTEQEAATWLQNRISSTVKL